MMEILIEGSGNVVRAIRMGKASQRSSAAPPRSSPRMIAA